MTYSYIKVETHQTLIHFVYDWSNKNNITSKIIKAVVYYVKIEQMAALDDIMMLLMFCQIISESIKGWQHCVNVLPPVYLCVLLVVTCRYVM